MVFSHFILDLNNYLLFKMFPPSESCISFLVQTSVLSVKKCNRFLPGKCLQELELWWLRLTLKDNIKIFLREWVVRMWSGSTTCQCDTGSVAGGHMASCYGRSWHWGEPHIHQYQVLRNYSSCFAVDTVWRSHPAVLLKCMSAAFFVWRVSVNVSTDAVSLNQSSLVHPYILHQLIDWKLWWSG